MVSPIACRTTTPKIQLAPWEIVIAQHLSQSLRCIQSRDFNYFRISAALDAQSGIDIKARFLSIIRAGNSIIRELDYLNTVQCKQMLKATFVYVEKLEGGRNSDVATWKTLLEKQKGRLQESFRTNSVYATEEARRMIQPLRTEAQAAAAGIFVQGDSIVMQVFEILQRQMLIVSDPTRSREESIIAIHLMRSKVQMAVEAGVLSINVLPVTLPTGIPDVETKSTYVGIVVWPSEVAEQLASLEHNAMANDIRAQGWAVFDIAFQASKPKIGRVEFGSRKPLSNPSILPPVWKAAASRRLVIGRVIEAEDIEKPSGETRKQEQEQKKQQKRGILGQVRSWKGFRVLRLSLK